MRNRAFLQLAVDDLKDRGLAPGPAIVAELQMLRDQRLEAEQILAEKHLHLNALGELVYVRAL